ncbi:alpha/beta hydrolase domain-containing protein [Rhodanobacter koreensis]
MAAFALVITSQAAFAAVEHVEVIDRKPYQDGKVFPGVGPYEVIHGRAWFTLDPDSKANARIVDLKHAQRDSKGQVEFSTDFVLLRPTREIDSTLLYDVNNRGGQISGMLNFVIDPARKPPFVDTGFLQRNGFTVLASAWEWDVRPEGPDDHPLVFTPPIATDHGHTITGKVANEFTVEKPSDTASFVGIDGRAYPAAVADDPLAVLTARVRPGDPRAVVRRKLWSFVPATDGQPPTEIRMRDGFRPGLIYELTYTARDPYVVGAGMASIRDLLSWFRTHSFEGLPAPKRVLLYGASQTARLIQQMLYDGFDVDEQQRLVFDGALSLVGGSGRGSFNHRFAFPTRAANLVVDRDYPTDLFPFTTGEEHDPVTGQSGSLLTRARDSAGKSPRLFLVNKSTEFWGRSASLLETTPDGSRDVAPDPNTRLYLLAGMQHLITPDPTRGSTINCSDPVDDQSSLRALLLDLDRWVRDEALPPDSAYPTLASGTLVSAARYRQLFPKGTGLVPPDSPFIPARLDFGPRFTTQGIIDRLPPARGRPYTVLVPAPDADGTDSAGLRPVEVQVPLGTYTGWNQNNADTGFGWAFDRFEGSFQPFARTEAERKAAGDPRPSLEARYGSRSAFIEKTRAAANQAVARHLLLAEDVDRTVAAQAAFYDRIMARTPGDMSCRYLWPIPFN